MVLHRLSWIRVRGKPGVCEGFGRGYIVRMRTSSLLLPLLLALPACTKVESSSILTKGMSASMSVSADGTGKSVASASLRVGDSAVDFVDLSSGDSLVASSGAKSQTLSRSVLFNVVTYSTSFSGLDAGDTPYTIAFKRSLDAGAPSSTCTLPAPFTLTTPAPGASLSRGGADITLTWQGGTADKMRYELKGDCLASKSDAITGDPGTLVIPRGTVAVNDPKNAGQTCTGTLVVRRRRDGKLDPAFGHGGNIYGEQVRSVTFTSTP